MRIASHSGQRGRYTLISDFNQCSLFFKPSQIRQWKASTFDFTKNMMRRVDVTEQAHNIVMQAMGKHNLVTGYFRVGGCSPNMVYLACFFVDYLESVLTHGIPYFIAGTIPATAHIYMGSSWHCLNALHLAMIWAVWRAHIV